MIQETKRKINFTPYYPEKGRHEDTSPAPTLTIHSKHGIISFGKHAFSQLKMDGKFIAFYYEPVKGIIGFNLREDLTEGELKLGKYRLVKAKTFGRSTSPTYRTTIQGIMEKLSKKTAKEHYNKLEIKKYVETEGIMERDTIYYYVELEDEVVRPRNT